MDFKIIGHEKEIEFLLEKVRKRENSHGYIFAGPDGIGKKRVGLLMAATLLCQGDLKESPCLVCPQCKKVISGNHPDLFLIGPDGDRVKIQQIREINREINIKPFEGRKKIFIIEKGEGLTIEGSNALLKTLEEPPDYGIIIIITSNIEQIIATIKSRLQIINFRNLTVEETLNILKDNLNSEKLEFLKKIQCNSPGRGLKIIENINKYKKIVEDAFVFLKGPRDNGAWGLINLQGLEEDEIEFFFDYIILLLRDGLYAALGMDNNIINCDNITDIREISNNYDISSLKEQIYLTETCKGLLKKNVNPKAVLDYCIINLKGEKYG